MKLCITLLALCLGVALGAPPTIISKTLDTIHLQKAEQPNFRLNTDFYPISYDITLKPYLRSEDGDKQFTFDGESSVIFSTKKEGLRSVTLHVRNLDNLKVDLKETSTGEIIWIDHIGEVDKVTDKWTLTIETPFKKDVEYTLHFTY
uniref:Aminopeptidase N n=1 Tax=Megaselia scalaris TaxID=36166 RepID=T1GJ34_MEGSC